MSLLRQICSHSWRIDDVGIWRVHLTDMADITPNEYVAPEYLILPPLVTSGNFGHLIHWNYCDTWSDIIDTFIDNYCQNYWTFYSKSYFRSIPNFCIMKTNDLSNYHYRSSFGFHMVLNATGKTFGTRNTLTKWDHILDAKSYTSFYNWLNLADFYTSIDEKTGY